MSGQLGPVIRPGSPAAGFAAEVDEMTEYVPLIGEEVEARVNEMREYVPLIGEEVEARVDETEVPRRETARVASLDVFRGLSIAVSKTGKIAGPVWI